MAMTGVILRFANPTVSRNPQYGSHHGGQCVDLGTQIRRVWKSPSRRRCASSEARVLETAFGDACRRVPAQDVVLTGQTVTTRAAPFSANGRNDCCGRRPLLANCDAPKRGFTPACSGATTTIFLRESKKYCGVPAITP